jgi:hypothetical protein
MNGKSLPKSLSTHGGPSPGVTGYKLRAGKKHAIFVLREKICHLTLISTEILTRLPHQDLLQLLWTTKMMGIFVENLGEHRKSPHAMVYHHFPDHQCPMFNKII